MEKRIIIEFTDDLSKIRNSGTGDYFYNEEGHLIVRAWLKDADSLNEAWLIAMHELIEQRLTESRGIKEETIDAFDRAIDETGGISDEAGNEPDCPYKQEHRFAENVERQLALELGVDWFDYYENYNPS